MRTATGGVSARGMSASRGSVAGRCAMGSQWDLTPTKPNYMKENLRVSVGTSGGSARRTALRADSCGGEKVRADTALLAVREFLGIRSRPALDKSQSSCAITQKRENIHLGDKQRHTCWWHQRQLRPGQGCLGTRRDS